MAETDNTRVHAFPPDPEGTRQFNHPKLTTCCKPSESLLSQLQPTAGRTLPDQLCYNLDLLLYEHQLTLLCKQCPSKHCTSSQPASRCKNQHTILNLADQTFTVMVLTDWKLRGLISAARPPPPSSPSNAHIMSYCWPVTHTESV